MLPRLGRQVVGRGVEQATMRARLIRPLLTILRNELDSSLPETAALLANSYASNLIQDRLKIYESASSGVLAAEVCEKK